MKRGKKWLQWVVPLMAVTFLGFAQAAFAQDDYQYDDNSGNYNNSDEALIQPESDVDYNSFHDELSPYGSWRDYPGYGNVWVCNVSGFSPYNTGGHWAYTRFGWTWVSDYNWGWAPFHYGRWGYDNSFGYFWVPGYTWGPAWVSWRNGGDYYGWAPLSPGLNVGINVGIGFGAASWTFLPHRYMGYRNSYSYYAPRQNNVTIIRNTTIINNTHIYNNNRFVTGPDRRQVERYSGQRVQQQNIYVTNNRDDNRQVNNGIRVYNPVRNRGVNNRNGFQNGQQENRGVQGNLRQQPSGGRPTQIGTQQQPNNNGANDAQGNRSVDRFQQRREERIERREDKNDIGNGVVNNGQRRQDMRDRMQNRNSDERRQQMEQTRQQHQQQDVQSNEQQDVQRQQQRQQQLNDKRQQMQQQMEQTRQERDAQQQQVQQQNRQEETQQQRQQIQQQRQEQTQQRQQQMDQQKQQMQQQRQQQMQQQRQQQFQQRNQNTNRPAIQQGGGGRRGKNV